MQSGLRDERFAHGRHTKKSLVDFGAIWIIFLLFGLALFPGHSDLISSLPECRGYSSLWRKKTASNKAAKLSHGGRKMQLENHFSTRYGRLPAFSQVANNKRIEGSNICVSEGREQLTRKIEAYWSLELHALRLEQFARENDLPLLSYLFSVAKITALEDRKSIEMTLKKLPLK